MRLLVSLGVLVVPVVLAVPALLACVARPLELGVAVAESSSVIVAPVVVEARSDTCVSLDGDAAGCCPSRLGLDPEFVRDRCGWSEYLGERGEISCLHVFRDRRGERVELRVTSIVGLGFSRALQLLATSFVEIEGVEPEVWRGTAGREISRVAHAGSNWAVVGGWPDPRRVSWRSSDCVDEAMLAVLVQMSEAPIDPAGAIALPEFDLDPESSLVLTGLLADRSAPTIGGRDSSLPDDAPSFAEAVIDHAAANDLAGFANLLAPEARWGLPDRRQIGGRAILDASRGDASVALAGLRGAAARMQTGAPPKCVAPDRRLRSAMVRGELEQWCFWLSDDGLDVIALGLRNIDGHARLEYLGVFPQRPTAPILVPGEPPPPPLRPLPRLDCGDPHQHDPVRCPELVEPDSDSSDDDQANQRPASTLR